MSEEFLSCPRCGCLKFYSRGDEGKLIFFQVDTDFRPVATGVKTSDLSKTNFSPIYCTGCSWSGEIRDLASKLKNVNQPPI